MLDPVALVEVHGDTGGIGRDQFAGLALHVLHQEAASARISITFVDPRRMRNLNARFLQHDNSTDVLTFALPQPGGLAADVYICRHAAARNARAHGVSTRDELRRLVVHGVLHAVGWDHPVDGTRGRSPMWKRQEQYLAATR